MKDLDLIIYKVSEYYNVTDIRLKTRKREILIPRQFAQYYAKNNTRHSLAVIGSYIGGKDHATVMHSCKVINNLIETDKEYKNDFEYISKILDASFKENVRYIRAKRCKELLRDTRNTLKGLEALIGTITFETYEDCNNVLNLHIEVYTKRIEKLEELLETYTN